VQATIPGIFGLRKPFLKLGTPTSNMLSSDQYSLLCDADAGAGLICPSKGVPIPRRDGDIREENLPGVQ
jgi:hypothetical protein